MDDSSRKQKVRDLRQALEDQGSPWQLDASLCDDEYLPEYPPGATREHVIALLAKAKIAARRDPRTVLREVGPPHGYLARVWRAAGLIDDDEAALYGDPPDRDHSSHTAEPPAAAEY